jgi:hypothetical protein
MKRYKGSEGDWEIGDWEMGNWEMVNWEIDLTLVIFIV